jgi:methylmalonyl-CoA/ethylmalonyl-CoA epimerase
MGYSKVSGTSVRKRICGTVAHMEESSMIKKINHVAIAVKDLEESARFYEEVLGLRSSGTEVVAAQKTRVGFFKAGESNIELVTPAEPGSLLEKFLETKGPGIHHICLEVDDIEAEMKALVEKGATLIDRSPRPGAHQSKVAFVHPKSSSGVLIELVELPKEH